MDVLSLNTNSVNRLYALVAFALTFAVYILTLCPTVYVGDSGEFITTAATLGINHPTGYTLYTLLARIAVMAAPFWTAAYAVNFFSALCAALTVLCLFYLLRLFTERNDIALAFSLFFGFSYTFWSRATSAEVYSLNALFIALSLLFVVRWYFSQQPTDLVILAYVVGLGLAQHITGALVAPGIALLVLLKQPRIVLNVKLLLVLIGVAALGFSTYLYLPIRTAANPPIDWGNPENLQRIVGHFFPKSSQALFGETTTGYYAGRMQWILLQVFTIEFWYFGAFAFIGLIALSQHWRLIVFCLVVAGLNAWFTVVRKIPLHADFDAYFLPSYIVMAMLICIGFTWGWKTLSASWSDKRRRLARIPYIAGAFALPALLLTQHYRENDRSNNWFGYDFGMNMLSTVPQNAILFTVGDEQTFISWYFKYAEKLRPDIIVIDRNLLGAIWGGSHMYNSELKLPIREEQAPELIARQILSRTFDQRPVFFTPRVPWTFVAEQYDLSHNGMTIQLMPKGAAVPAYRSTEYSFHPDWNRQFFDERCKLIVKFFYKEYVDNAKYWYSKGDKDAALNELATFLNFPYRREDEDTRTAFLLLAQIRADRKQFDEAIAAADSAEAYGATDWRVHELKGNISYLQRDTANALRHWKTSMAYNPGNEKLQRNIDILLNPPPTLPRRMPPNMNRQRTRPSNNPLRRNR